MTSTEPLVTYADIEVQTRDDLAAAMADEIDGDLCTIGISLPPDWTKGSIPRIRVALDGTPRDLHPIAQQSTMRITVWASSPSTAKELANLAHGYLLNLGAYKRLTGLFVARDPDHGADLASFTVRATVRSTPITGS